MNFRSVQDLNSIISTNISLLKCENFELVVGVPRSGMLPASILALKLNLPLMSISEYIDNSAITHGRTRKPSSKIVKAHDALKVLIVDDSISSGDSIREVKVKIPEHLLGKCRFMAIYGVGKNTDIDIVLETVALPRIFEWNAMYHGIVKDACFDIDGVLCEDPAEWQNDDGEKYLEFIENAKPLYLPLTTIDTLVTNRLEKYRRETEAWLKKYNIKYHRLEMLQVESKEERLDQVDYFKHKSDVYKKSSAKIFYESSLQQAQEIYKRTKKPVYCVDEHFLITPTILRSLLKPKTLKWIVKERLYSYKLIRTTSKLIKKLRYVK